MNTPTKTHGEMSALRVEPQYFGDNTFDSLPIVGG